MKTQADTGMSRVKARLERTRELIAESKRLIEQTQALEDELMRAKSPRQSGGGK